MLKRGVAPFPADTNQIWSEVDHTQIPLAPHVLRERTLLDENMFLKVYPWLALLLALLLWLCLMAMDVAA